MTGSDGAERNDQAQPVERWRRSIAGSRIDLYPSPALLGAIGERVSGLLADDSPLLPEDAIALAILEFRIGLTVHFTEPGKVITRAREIEFETVAVGTVALIYMSALIARGIVPFGASQADTETAVNRWWLAWCAAVEGSPDGNADDHARHAAIRAHVEAIIRPHLAPPAAALASARKGVRRWHRNHGRRVEARNVTREEAAAEFSALTLLRPAPLGLFFKNADGKLQISDTELRDRLGRRKKLADPLEGAGELESDPLNADCAIEAVDAVDAVALLETLRASAMAGARPGSADRAVLEHLGELASGALTPTELARRCDLNERTVQIAWKRWRERLRDHPRARDLRDDA